jgi:hypothetical protein
VLHFCMNRIQRRRLEKLQETESFVRDQKSKLDPHVIRLKPLRHLEEPKPLDQETFDRWGSLARKEVELNRAIVTLLREGIKKQ